MRYKRVESWAVGKKSNRQRAVGKISVENRQKAINLKLRAKAEDNNKIVNLIIKEII